MVVVPNTPSMLTKLYTIKHIIEIIPIKFPMGFPDDEVSNAGLIGYSDTLGTSDAVIPFLPELELEMNSL